MKNMQTLKKGEQAWFEETEATDEDEDQDDAEGSAIEDVVIQDHEEFSLPDQLSMTIIQ